MVHLNIHALIYQKPEAERLCKHRNQLCLWLELCIIPSDNQMSVYSTLLCNRPKKFKDILMCKQDLFSPINTRLVDVIDGHKLWSWEMTDK